jgi:D-lactate dehydrogenase
MGDYRLDHLVGFDCMEKVGIIGTGKIGGAFAKMCMVLVAKFWPVIRGKSGINPANRYNLPHSKRFVNSDIISVHCPLNSETKYMFNKRSFNLMKKELSLLMQEELS